MAFWDRKDESEWEKYQRLQQTADRARQEPQEQEPPVPLAERLMAKLRPAREETPPLPPERCPWCGGEMEHGYVSFGRDRVVWTAEKPGVLLGTMRAKEKVEIGGRLFASNTAGCFCRACRKLAVDIPTPSPEQMEQLARTMDTQAAAEYAKQKEGDN